MPKKRIRGSIQLNHGVWYMVVSYYDANGKRKQKWITTGLKQKNNRRKAEDMLQDYLAAHRDDELDSCNSDMLFADWVVKWLELVKPSIDIVTYEGYEMHSRHVVQYFREKGYCLKDLRSRHIEEYYNFMLTKGKNQGTDKETGLAPRTVRSHKFIIKASLDRAVIWELIRSNPAACVKVTNKRSKDLTKEICFFTAEQANSFIKFVYEKEDVLADVIFIAIYYGLRRSEILGLTTDAVDLKAKKLYINRTVVTATNTYEKNKTKTRASGEAMNITDETIPFFQSVLAKKQEYKKFFGHDYIESDYLFTWQDGHSFRPDYIYHHFKKLASEFGRPEMTFHQLRHTCASILCEKGWPPKEIQIWLRHADFTTTMNIYTHISQYHNRENAEKIQGTVYIPYEKTDNEKDVRKDVRKKEKDSDRETENP